MSKKLQIAIRQKHNVMKVKIRYLMVGLAMVAAGWPSGFVVAEECPDLRIVFARGSGASQDTDKNYEAFKTGLETRLAGTGLDYQFVNLEYPAVGVGIENFWVTAGALFGGGEAYEFGDSVAAGSQKLEQMVNSETCAKTKYVLGGYSQGAIVVSRTLPRLNADKLIYAATFGDPKIYLPEGKGWFPAACRGENLSEYRMYVPDCQTYEGVLGGYQPYQPEGLSGKLGTWCNGHDFFCSPFLSMDKHTAYVADNLYEDADRVIFHKISQEFGLGGRVLAPHDTVILLDSSKSMEKLIEKYKTETLRLTKETLASGGRVALFDYRDLKDPYTPREHCNFDTCTLEKVQEELDQIETKGGGDANESLLSAAWTVMKKLEWKRGATKSLVILTDAGYLNPDRDGMTLDKVVQLSKEIDPVNFYIISIPGSGILHRELAKLTDGEVVTSVDQLSLLVDKIMDRYDSLSRVEETAPVALPELTVQAVEQLDASSARVKFETTGSKTLVVLNDAILGTTAETEITLQGLDQLVKNELRLVPMNDEARGAGETVTLNDGMNYWEQNMVTGDGTVAENDVSETPRVIKQDVVLPKAPNTGRVKN